VSSEVAAYLSSALSDATGSDLAAPVFRASQSSTDEPTAETIATSCAQEMRSDEELLLQVGGGSKEALSTLFQHHAHQVFHVARRILRDDAEAEDLLQDVFLLLFQKARTFDGTKSSAISWIVQIAYHRAIDRRRFLTFRQHYNFQELDEDRQHANAVQISINDVAARALLGKLRDNLSEEQRQTLELHFFEGYTFHEIAERTGQALGNVRHHYYRGLEKLRSFVFPGKTHLK
jgi:RNA polymerase sigma-70 factor, ECF subfamily